MLQQSQRIKTNIKFKQNERGVFYGFVTKNERVPGEGVMKIVMSRRKSCLLMNMRKTTLLLEHSTK